MGFLQSRVGQEFVLFLVIFFSLQFLESMSELILKGIDEASKELEKENTEKLMNEVGLALAVLNTVMP